MFFKKQIVFSKELEIISMALAPKDPKFVASKPFTFIIIYETLYI